MPPECAAQAPLDPFFPNSTGAIMGMGHDVWSWASGVSRGALPFGPETVDVMSYCDARWIGPYTYGAILQWRTASAVVTRTVRGEPAIAMP